MDNTVVLNGFFGEMSNGMNVTVRDRKVDFDAKTLNKGDFAYLDRLFETKYDSWYWENDDDESNRKIRAARIKTRVLPDKVFVENGAFRSFKKATREYNRIPKDDARARLKAYKLWHAEANSEELYNSDFD